jgi:hypothetical protein
MMQREIAAKKIIDGQKTYSHVERDNLNDLIESGWIIVYTDTDEPVPEDKYNEILTPKLYTLKELLQNHE